MDDYKHLCPVCKANGHANFLQLRQISLETAVYLCSDIKCKYPLGHSWVYVKRKLLDEDSDSYSDISDELNDEIGKMNISLSLPIKSKTPDAFTSNLKKNLSSDVGNKDTKVEISKETGVKQLETFKEIRDIVIDNSDKLFDTLSLSSNTELQPTVLAVGSCDTDTVYLNNDIETSNELQFDVIQEQPGKFKIDFKIEQLSQKNTNSNNDESTVTPDLVADESNMSNDFPVIDFNDPLCLIKIQRSRVSKFKRKIIKEPKTFTFSDEVLKQALFMKIDEPKYKPTLVEQIRGKMNNGPLKNPADNFKDFKFKTEIIKEPSYKVSVTEIIKDKMPPRRKNQTEPKNLLEPVKLGKNNKKKEKSKDLSTPVKNCEKELPVTIKKESPKNSIPDDSHAGEHSFLNNWLDNMDDPEKIPTAKVDPEFEEWLSSF